MSDEAREILYTAANFIFLGAVLFIAMLFFDLRSDYGRTIAENEAAEKRVIEANRYGGYDSLEVTGYDVMNGVTAYSSDILVYVTGAYNNISGAVHTGRLYSAATRDSNPDWFKMSVAADPMKDANGLQSMYGQDVVYYAMLVYDGTTPDQLARDMGIDTPAGRNASVPTLSAKISWINTKYKTARPGEAFGYQVSGILFICLDAPSAPTAQYRQVAIY